MDRDDKGDKRIPVLMNYLKLKVTDSIYPLHDKHAVFRIELEYGDGAVKWVIYRELKDFVNLHAHYRVANLRQGIEKFPAFPKTSLPYLNWLKNEGKGHVKKAEFARLQREALENYLLKLIRATMFGPGANRLCKFLEISAMSIMLATRGGEQGKQGYLRVTSSGASRRRPPGFHPLSWKKRHDPKWFLVRDSFIVAVESPASTEVFDVIMVDSTFELERPARAYRKGLQLLHADGSHESLAMPEGTTGDLKPAKPSGYRGAGDPNDPSTTSAAEGLEHQDDLRTTSAHTFYLRTSERKMRLVAKTERQQDQFIASIERMLAKTIWAGKNRFDSFAPIRLNVAAQWLIDGRDYFWSLSRAIALAKHKIFIHDWWLSPELYLRRPPAANEKWRLDRLLQRKAREGVEIYVIVYNEVSDGFTPVSSAYTKASLRALHPNIHVQRSPSHVATGTLLWSHHEKMCVIDETIGFMGGLDLCFGRWDTPGHVLIDDGPNYADSPDAKTLGQQELARSQIWPGKDYANQRVLDFHTLQKPFEDMYDRSKVPRQPWHDIGLQIIGQPARDLCRHFIQRWNYLLRTKNHSIKMPFLVPAPDFTPEQLQELRITGTCEVQICRSVSPWSMGISHVEHSIQNAYIKAIQLSDHFVYIENQFFITSTEVEGTVVTNKIGDALVSRIVRAHSEGTPWRAVVVIPMEPGYPYPLDHSDASSVRLIMECQFRSICRGEGSIFARLRHEGIDPDEYISFFGLRGWGTLSSGALTTESTYIHAKSMIVDDRIAIIGSANINERSQRGDRDSELACVIRDTDMIDSTMAGQPYQVGRFAHTMRMRLMREHLGVNVDELEASEGKEELEAREADEIKHRDEEWDPDHEQSHGTNRGVKGGRTSRFIRSVIGSGAEYVGATASGVTQASAMGLEKTGRKVKNSVLPSNSDHQHDEKPEGLDSEQETKADKIAAGEEGSAGFASTVVPTIEEKVMAENRPASDKREQEDIREANKSQPTNIERENGPATHKPNQKREEEEEEQGSPGEQFPARMAAQKSSKGGKDQEPDEAGEVTSQHNTSADDTRKLMSQSGEDGSNASGTTLDGSADGQPASPHRTTNNADGNEKAASRNAVTSAIKRNLRERGPYTVPLAAPKVDPYGFADPLVDSFYKDVWLAAAARNTQVYRKVFRCMPDDLVQTWKQYREFQRSHHNGHVITRRARSNTQDLEAMDGAGLEGKKSGRGRSGTLFGGSGKDAGPDGKNAGGEGSAAPSASATTGQTGNETHDHDEAFPEEERQQMKALLEEVTGQLVVFPTRFLEAESAGGNFLFSKDRIPYVTNSPVCPQVLCADLSVFSRRRIGERQPFGRESGSRQTCPNTFADCSPCRSTTKPAPAPPQARSSDTTHTKTP
ncbi:phospholipase D [Rhodotorula sp. JG-1b]|nr:phospholipase D [Rhodotorula sp. JG-1b]